MKNPYQDDKMIYELTKRAEAGELEAQCELASRYLFGDGVDEDHSVGMKWLILGAKGGNPWAQTEYAIKLRASKDIFNERESISWLEKACKQGYTEARFTLGSQQYLGIGTQVDYEASFVNLIMASLDGHYLAKKSLDESIDIVDNKFLHIFDEVNWSNMMFCMGPLVDGHLPEITNNRIQNPNDINAEWMDFEKEVSEANFLVKNNKSYFSSFFGVDVSVKDLHVGIVNIGEEPLSVTTISLKNIIRKNGLPVYWRPNSSEIDPILTILSAMNARKFILYNYERF